MGMKTAIHVQAMNKQWEWQTALVDKWIRLQCCGNILEITADEDGWTVRDGLSHRLVILPEAANAIKIEWNQERKEKNAQKEEGTGSPAPGK